MDRKDSVRKWNRRTVGWRMLYFVALACVALETFLFLFGEEPLGLGGAAVFAALWASEAIDRTEFQRALLEIESVLLHSDRQPDQ